LLAILSNLINGPKHVLTSNDYLACTVIIYPLYEFKL